MIRAYLYFIIGDLCERAADWSEALGRYLDRQYTVWMSRSYMAQGKGKGPWVDG